MSNSQTTALAALSQSLACPMNLLRLTDKGVYCPAGGFYIDPWTRVDRALVTHAHSDHAVPGSRNYLACQAGEHILIKRLGPMGRKSFLRYGESKTVNGVRVSFHPAGHV
ncbi:MAG: DNA ligase-associated DEXH box helicase, partial [Planctomycetota bacterium]|nr:DNA ligase-associated DEXH box helicase [Planctomycetota bacterium]